jgi:hypothetical protein
VAAQSCAVRVLQVLLGAAQRDLRPLPRVRQPLGRTAFVTVVVGFLGPGAGVIAADSEGTESHHSRFEVEKTQPG